MLRKLAARLVIVAAVGLAGWLIYRTLKEQSLDDIVASIWQIPTGHLLAAVGFAFLSYFCLTLFDTLAIRYVGRKLAYPKIAIASFTSLSIGHNVGGAALSSGAIRYRFYTRWGLSAEEVAKVILFCGITVGLGLVTLAGLCSLVVSAGTARMTGFSRTGVLILGAACIAVTIGYVTLAHFLRGSLRIVRWRFKLPSSALAACQVIVGTANFLCVSACLHQLLRAFANPTFLDTAAAYVGANAVAIFSHVPGGVGVLEATIVFLLGGSGTIAALIAFRAIYFFLPLPLGLVSLSIAELVVRRNDGRDLASKAKT